MGEDAEPPWTPEERAAIIAELRREFPGRHLYPVQRGNLANEWENMGDAARRRDAHSRDPRESSAAPTLAALVAAVRRTQLTRFYPFTGLEYLYFADGPGVWDQEGVVAPVRIGWNRSEEYRVLHELPDQEACTLTTHDPDEAAAEAERLLTGWPRSGKES